MPSKRHLHNHLNDFPKDRTSCITTSHVTESRGNGKTEECQSTAQASKPQAKHSATLDIKVKKT